MNVEERHKPDRSGFPIRVCEGCPYGDEALSQTRPVGIPYSGIGGTKSPAAVGHKPDRSGFPIRDEDGEMANRKVTNPTGRDSLFGQDFVPIGGTKRHKPDRSGFPIRA